MTARAGQSGMKRVFAEAFAARDLAESLASFDDIHPAAEARDLLTISGFDVAGVRVNGQVAGFLVTADLRQGKCGESLRQFSSEAILPDSASLGRVIRTLAGRPYLFVTSFGRVGGIITRADLQKAPVRMWLFGMISLVEMEFSRLIKEFFPDDAWRRHLSAARLVKAAELYAERCRINQEITLLDCLQFSDKGRIIVKDQVLRQGLGFTSSKSAKDAFKQIEHLRNNLAHSQDIVTHNWEMITTLTTCLDIMFSPEGPPKGQP